MNNLPQKTQSLEVQSSSIKDYNKSVNPRKAATKAKEVNNQIEVMRRRIQALQVQQDYNRYKTVEQEKKIHQYNEIRFKITKQSEVLKKSLEWGKDISEVKQKAKQLRLQIRQKIKQARKSVIQEKTERTHLISQESVKYENKIKQYRIKDLQENRSRKMTIQTHQDKARLSISRHAVNKIQKIKANKSVDTSALNRKTQQSQTELSRLMAYQQQLLTKNSQMLKASSVMKHKFNDLFTTISTQNSSQLLPEIRARLNSKAT